MKNSLFIILAIISFIQAKAQANSNALDLEETSKEKIYVHVNTSMPFVGEYIYYKINCLKTGSNEYSNISKTAYLDLIDKDHKSVYSQTIDLKDGKGYGDFFIQTDVGSGNYKLIVYTNWMKNNPEHKFFEQDIFIINPYTSAQAEVRKDSIQYSKPAIKNNPNIKLSKSQFHNREKAEVHLQDLENGDYSVSIRQVDSLPHPAVISSTEFANSSGNSRKGGAKTYVLPDLRGKLLSGKISSKANLSVSNKDLALSVPGKDYFLRMAITDKMGNFYINVDENYVDENALIQVLNGNGKYEININENDLPDISGLDFKEYGIDARAEKFIKNRSVYNQIENAYFSLKPDTIRVNHPKNIFDGLNQIVFDLDDYTRFETIKETFVEIVPFARVRTRDGKFEFGVLGKPPYENFDGKPLVVVDGLVLQDTDSFIRNFKSVRIDKIKVVQEPYYLSSSFYKGIIIIETINGDFAENYTRDYLKQLKLTTGNVRKNYFHQKYKDGDSSTLPDFRTQLLWIPNLESNTSKNLSFYTSDIDGVFEISVQGFTADGHPVSYQHTFKVK